MFRFRQAVRSPQCLPVTNSGSAFYATCQPQQKLKELIRRIKIDNEPSLVGREPAESEPFEFRRTRADARVRLRNIGLLFTISDSATQPAAARTELPPD